MFRTLQVVLFTFIFLWSGISAYATPLSVLVSEKAEEFMAYEMPENGSFDISFFNLDDFEVAVINNFAMDRGTGRFVVDVIDNNGNSSKIAGLALLMVEVPLATRQIMPNEIISESDISLQKILFNRVSPLSVTDTEKLIGFQVKRMISQGKPILDNSITPPILVKKGDRVVISFQDGNMTLTAPGKSLDEGYRGKEIRIVNLISNKTVLGVAVKDGLVEIQN